MENLLHIIDNVEHYLSIIFLFGLFIFFIIYTLWPDRKTIFPRNLDPGVNYIKENNTVDKIYNKMSDVEKIMLAQKEVANPTTIWVLFMFLGWSYGSLGKIEIQILYYLTCGGLGVWTLIRLFTLNTAIKKYNREVYAKYGIVNA